MPDMTFCRQPGQGLLRVSGRDARRFLHAQTTQRIDDLPPGETRLAAWLSARGRVLALFDVVPEGDGFLLILPADNLAAVSGGLRRYVLRDQVRIEPAADRSILTVIGDVAAWSAGRDVALPLHAVATAGDAILARTGERRVDIIVTAGTLPAPPASAASSAPPVPPVPPVPPALTALFDGLVETDSDAAALAAIAEGRPEVPAALADRYTPHMLNLERSAVSFTKGCYPGQEIVARTEHRGEAKRRIRRFACAAGVRPAAGDGIVAAAGATDVAGVAHVAGAADVAGAAGVTGAANVAGAPAGEVNRSAASREGFELLAVVGSDDRGGGLQLADGRALRPLPI